ncbi:hypothetical protein TM233_19760 [Bradyrhizobium sp. TM233]|nr:hypothetical protein TM233_19760 [Bradyrhizobium sp. TM233]
MIPVSRNLPSDISQARSSTRKPCRAAKKSTSSRMVQLPGVRSDAVLRRLSWRAKGSSECFSMLPLLGGLVGWVQIGNTARISSNALMGVLMPETLEILLWCAALATWLMLSFRIISERLKPLSNLVSHLLEVAFRHKTK